MKRVLLVFLLAMLPVICFAQKFEVVPFQFKVIGDNSVAIVNYDHKSNPTQEIVNIPSSVTYGTKKYNVTTINGDKSKVAIFYVSKKTLRISIPSSVTTIGEYAFFAASIESIEIPSSVTIISENAFYKCTDLKSITIPSYVTNIGEFAFRFCKNLKEVTIESKGISIDRFAFSFCPNLERIKIQSDNLSLGKDVFYGCNLLKTVYVKAAASQSIVGLKSNPLIVIIDEPQQTSAPTNTYIASVPAVQQPIAETPKIISDVDQNIPQTGLNNDKTFAVIIANEKYATESTVDFALNDGKIFKEYCEKTLGIPSENIRFVENGTLGSIGAGIGWLKKVLDIYKQDANAIVYYSGHGIPNEANGDAYILPTDCQGSDFQYAYSINRLYKELGEAGAKSVTYFIDACFSGTQRKGEMMVAARGVAIKAKSGVLSGNSVAFAAASGDETAFAYEEKGHGMFTYFLLKKLQETNGEVSYGELASYIQQNVKQKSIVVSPRLQSPNAISSTTASEGWQSWKLTK